MGRLWRYTDRDVREIDNASEIAIAYLEHYQGDFQFLVDCKMRAEMGTSLSIGMIRGILNCMRVDPRVPLDSLPEPQEWPEDVIPLPERSYSRRKTSADYQKQRVIEIKPRQLRFEGAYYYRRPASVHPEFLFAKGKSPSTRTVHLVTGAEVEWYPTRYIDEPGWTRKPELIVHTNCKYPYYLRNPKLLTVDHVEVGAAEDGLNRCHYCFYQENE